MKTTTKPTMILSKQMKHNDEIFLLRYSKQNNKLRQEDTGIFCQEKQLRQRTDNSNKTLGSNEHKQQATTFTTTDATSRLEVVNKAFANDANAIARK